MKLVDSIMIFSSEYKTANFKYLNIEADFAVDPESFGNIVWERKAPLGLDEIQGISICGGDGIGPTRVHNLIILKFFKMISN